MNILTLEEVTRQLEQIRSMAGDEEAAHLAEDRLHQLVLRAIADGRCEDVREAARIAMKSREISFSRWYS